MGLYERWEKLETWPWPFPAEAPFWSLGRGHCNADPHKYLLHWEEAP